MKWLTAKGQKGPLCCQLLGEKKSKCHTKPEACSFFSAVCLIGSEFINSVARVVYSET